MTVLPEAHIARAFSGPSELEADCPCPKAPCGGVINSQRDPHCPQHAISACKTIRSSHLAANCPCAKADS